MPVSIAEARAAHDRDWFCAAALMTVMTCELIWLAVDVVAARYVAYAAMLAVVPLSFRRLGVREGYLLTLCAMLTMMILWLHDSPAEALAVALDQAIFLMAFIMLVGLMQQAAMTSPAILECGLYLTKQRAGRRYFALFGGTHIMTQLFNLGVVSLLAPLIRRGTEDESDPLNPIREKRQLNSMLRGFAWAVVWSPTAVAPLVLTTLLPEAQRGPWIVAGLVIAVVVMLIGWAEDRWQHRDYVPAAGTTNPPFPVRAYGNFAFVCLALLGLTLAGMALFDESVVFGLMMASPIILFCWLAVQNGGDWAASKARLAEIGLGHLPRAAPLAVTLACSGYVGRAAAALIPAAEWSAALGLEAWPGWLFLLSLAVGVAALSQFALSPIMMAVFFGSLIAAVPELPTDITWAALAISCGWALTMTASPFATVVLMIAGATKHTGRELAWWWNWRFTAATTVFLGVAFWLLA
jgi:hypothetical protein